MAAFDVATLEALSDNYMYIISCRATKQAAVIDPVEPQKCVDAAKTAGFTIVCALTTHHHFDHAGGNAELKQLVPDVEIVGGDESIQSLTRSVQDAEVLHVGKLEVRCIHTPAHTSNHTSYLISNPSGEGPPAIFTGDCLFVGGCGRFFEGGPEQMLEGTTKLAALPPETLVYVGHEYTIKNLQFALDVEPDNPAAQAKILWAQEQRVASRATVPSTIGDEKTFNPFMRCAEPAVRAKVGASTDVECMRKLRNAKDNFAGTTRPWIPGGGPLPGL